MKYFDPTDIFCSVHCRNLTKLKKKKKKSTAPPSSGTYIVWQLVNVSNRWSVFRFWGHTVIERFRG